MMMRFKAMFVGRLALGLVAIAALGGVVMALWNAVIPGLLAGAQAIDDPHALGLLLLCRILFGGFRGYGGWRRGWHGHRFGHRRCGPDWHAMTPEEREQFRRGIRPDHRPDHRSHHQHPDARTGVPE
jgi:hypothetical protein